MPKPRHWHRERTAPTCPSQPSRPRGPRWKADREWRVGLEFGFGFGFAFGCWAVQVFASSRELFIPSTGNSMIGVGHD